MTRLVVIGGDAAGMSAASKARRTDPSLEIVALEAGPNTSYSMCGLPYLVAGRVSPPERLIARTPEQFRAQRIEVLLGHRAHTLDLHSGHVEATRQDGDEVRLAFDRLVIGTGARPRRLGIPGEDLPGVFPLRDLRDGVAMRAWAERPDVHAAVVIGGGYVGMEMVESLLHRGLAVTVVQRGRQVMGGLDPDLAEIVQAELRKQGARLLLSSQVQRLEGDATRVRSAMVGGQAVPADLVVVAAGVIPSSEIASEAGLPTGENGAILVGDDQRIVGSEHLFAAGDCATATLRLTGKPTWIPLGTTANKQGRVAGENAAGGSARFPGILGTIITRVCDVEVAGTGLSLERALAAGFDAVAATIRSTDIAGYYPGARPLVVRLVGERGSGRLLGGVFVGSGVKRVDTVATALHAGLTADDLGWVDLAYAPPFSSVWDPVLVAAQELAKLL